jgi:hypothetical protein
MSGAIGQAAFSGVDKKTMSSATIKPESRERRRSHRAPCICEAWLSSPTSRDPADRVEVTTLNLSRHGVAFELPVAVPTGAYFLLRFTIGPQQISSEIRILTCRAGDESFQIGAEFC